MVMNCASKSSLHPYQARSVQRFLDAATATHRNIVNASMDSVKKYHERS